MSNPEYILFGLAALVFLVVAGLVGIAVLVSLVQRSRAASAKPTAATIYPIPPAERGTGQHVTLLDLFDKHTAQVDAQRKLQKLTDAIHSLVNADPKAPA